MNVYSSSFSRSQKPPSFASKWIIRITTFNGRITDKQERWLSSTYVQGAWNEIQQDFLAQNPMTPEAAKEQVVKLAKDAINSKDPKYLVYHPEKAEWTSDDHHVRFIATLILDNRLKGLWSDGDWRTKSTDITKAAFEVLSFLRAASLKTADSGPPGYDE